MIDTKPPNTRTVLSLTVCGGGVNIENGGHMYLALEDRPLTSEHSICKGVQGHLNLDVLGRDFSTLFIGDVEGNIVMAMIQVEPVRDG